MLNKNIYFFITVVVLLSVSSACRVNLKNKTKIDQFLQSNRSPDNFTHNMVGVDRYGRVFSTLAGERDNKQVGMFFWLWIGQPYASHVFDATKILAMPNGLKLLTDFNFQNDEISPKGQAHFWGEPVWGYYNSEDEWVLRKQIEMLTIAGIDFIYFDTTNTFIYKNVFMKLLDIIDEYQRSGFNPPKVAFYTHSRSFQTTRDIYKELYEPNLFPETWYKVDGKPMIIAYTNAEDDLEEAKSRSDNDYVPGTLSEEILNFFYFYKPQWPADPVHDNGFPWVEWIHPQPLHNSVMNVTVASHPSVPMSFSLTKEEMINWGRGWDPITKKNISENVDKGTFFQTQWDYALSVDPDVISIGGWNEWIAYKQPYWDEYVLVDAVDRQYSRDIEPMRGGYEDAFYIQMIQNVRKYKGVSGYPTFSSKKTINIDEGKEQWEELAVTGQAINPHGLERNAYGASMEVEYKQPAPENIITEVKVSYDEKYIYFLIEGLHQFSKPEKKTNWINILIGTGEPSLKNWESYEYVLGKEYKGEDISIHKLGKNFESIGLADAKYTMTENVLQIQCPREAVGLKNIDRFYFKVAADVLEPNDIMSYYTSGSTLPIGRLSYMFLMKD